MRLDHDFLVVDSSAHESAEYLKLVRHPERCQIHDDVLQYMVGTLDWIRTLNPSTRRQQYGLNLCAVTAILSEAIKSIEGSTAQ